MRAPLYSMLYQDEVWRSGGGPEVPLESLSACHLRNILRWLADRAERLSFALDYSIASSKLKAAGDVPLTTDEYKTAEEWLEATPLVGRIRELLDADDYALAMASTGPVTVHG